MFNFTQLSRFFDCRLAARRLDSGMFKWLCVLMTVTVMLQAEDAPKKNDPFGDKPWPKLKPGTPGAPSKGHTSYSGRQVRYFYNGKEFTPPDLSFSWDVDPSKALTRAEIRISEQKIYFYQGADVVVVGPVSTGRPSHPTPTGKFTVLEKDKDHKSTLYGAFVNSKGHIVDAEATPGDSAPAGAHYEAAEMKFYQRLAQDGVGFHAGFLPGFAASHGCIRLPAPLAEKLFDVVPVGLPVEILP
jgi:lipoprotein-anchoring transpeptidase ErfK/SrfK